MKKVIIIGSLESGTKNNPSVLAEHLKSKGIDVVVCFWEQLVFDIRTDTVRIFADGKEIVKDLQPELVIGLGWYRGGKQSYYRDLAFSTALYLQKAGVELWNSEMLEQRSTTKLSCMVQLALEGISVPRTLFSLDTDRVVLPQMPFIAKALGASRGEHNYLITSDEQAKEVLHDIAVNYLIQPFMPNDHDLRVICFGGEPSLVLRRSRGADGDTHLNNTSRGGQAEWLMVADMSDELLTVARKICIIMRREMGGIDFIPDSTSPFGYSCLEVNAIPQLTSGHDVAKKLDMLAQIILQKKEAR